MKLCNLVIFVLDSSAHVADTDHAYAVLNMLNLWIYFIFLS